jgi:hypothetical protein
VPRDDGKPAGSNPAGAALVPCLDEEQVLAFVAGRLDPPALAAAERHLADCRDCSETVAVFAGRTAPTGAQPLAAFPEGALIEGRYRIIRLIGAGGMGEVYQALDTALDEPIALKTIGLGVALDGPAIDRLKAEVQLARRVTHRNVCRVFDLGLHEEPDPRGGRARVTIPFLTMELLTGETLRAYQRRRGHLPPKEALSLLEGMAAGLDAAHAAGVVHADFKSENVMLVSESGGLRPVVMDFGLARQIKSGSMAGGSASLPSGGTPGYMAPEQMERKAGDAADIYALAVVLFEMLTGRLPYQGQTALSIAVQALGGPPPALRSLGVQAPPSWDRIIRRCLHRDPGHRFPSAAAVIAALRPPATGGLRPVRRALWVGAGIAAVVALALMLVVRRAPMSTIRTLPPPTATAATPIPAPPVTAPPAPPPPAATVAAPAVPPPLPTVSPGRGARKKAVKAERRRPAQTPLPEPGEDDAIDPFNR